MKIRKKKQKVDGLPGNPPETKVDEITRRVANLELQFKQVVIPQVDGFHKVVNGLDERLTIVENKK